MPSHQVLLSTTVQLTPPYKRRRKRNNHHHQGSNMSFSRLDMFSSSHNSIHSNNDVIGRNLNQISKEEFVIQENDSLAGQSAKRSSIHENDSMMASMISESKTRVRSISNPLPKVSQKARDSFSHSDTIVASSASSKNLSINKASPPSVLAAIPNISITTTTSNAIQQNSNLTIKGNNILTRLLRKSKESKMTKKHYHPPPLTRNSSNNQYLTVDGSLVTSNKKKHSNTTLSSFKSCSSSVSGINNTNQSLSNISCCSTDSNVVPFIESPNNSHSRGEMNFANPEGNNTENCLISDKVDLGKSCSIIDQEGDKNNYRTFESNGEKMTANATCLIDPTTILCLAEQEEAASSPIGVTNNPSSKFIRRLSSTLSQLSSQKPKRQKIRNCSNLSDCPQEIILHIASFILCTTTHTASLFAEFSISPTGANIIGSFSPSSITPIDSSTSTISRRNSSSTMRRIGHYPKYTPFPAELTRDYFNLMLTSKSFYSALEFDPENEDQFKNSIVEGFWKYMILWQYVYPNFPTIDKLEDYMRDLECKKALNISYKRLYSYVNTQSLQQKVVIPKKKNVVYDPSNYFYLLVAGVNFLVVQTIRALFFESKNDFECKSIKFNKEEFKVKVESCSFMDYSLAPNSAEYKFRGTDGVIFVAYMSSRSSLDAMIKYIEKCIEFRKKDEQRTTMDPPAAIILGTITKNTTLHEISLNDLWEVQKTYSYFIKDVVIVNTDTMENIQSSFEKISAMMYRARVKTYVKTLPIIDHALAKDDIALSQELKKRKSKLQIPSRNRKCTIM